MITSPANGLSANAIDVDTGIPIAAQIFVHNANVNLRNLIVDGSGNQINGCSPILVGVLFQNASGSVVELVMRHQKLASTYNGCQSGLALFVQGENGSGSNVTVSRSVAYDYQKNGITGNDTGATLVVEESSV